MNKRKTIIICVAIVLVIACVFFIKYQRDRKAELETPATSVEFIMDTSIVQKFYGKHAQEAVDEIVQKLRDYENTMSMHLANSEITKLNEAAGKEYVELSASTIEFLKKAKEYSEKSNRAFDITIAPLTTLWHITSPGEHSVPPQAEIDKALALVDYNDLLIDEENNKAMLKREGQSVDLGGIAKGASSQIVLDVVKKYNIKYGYVSLGGNLVVIGPDPSGQEYRFGVRDPLGTEQEYIGTITLTGKTMATTGGYERYFIENGVKYHHVLDPKTGYPAKSNLLSATVISENGMLADYLSTTMFVLGKDAALQYMSDERFSLILVDSDNHVYVSKNLESKYEANEDNTKYTTSFVE